MDRRKFLQAGTASLLLWQLPQAFGADVAANKSTNGTQENTKKVVWVILRGALDPLHTIAPLNDKNLVQWRPNIYPAIKDKLLPLNKEFGLHPSLKTLHQWYKSQELLPVVAVSSGYGKRSHFEGQDYLESGLSTIDTDNGWLARAIAIKNKKALAVANSIPTSLRSSSSSSSAGAEKNKANVDTWYPSHLKSASDEIYQPLLDMYQDDEKLLFSLESGLKVRDLVGMDMKPAKRSGNFENLSRSCGQLMAKSDGIDCAMLEVGGWDTHKSQVPKLNNQLKTLDSGLAALKAELGTQWQDTVVVVATEFGRTVKENGTGGTDHGTGSAMFFAGGAVNGGKVMGQWPGLAETQLFQGRDLQPTSNSFSWIATVLSQHWGFSPNQIEQVLPTAKLMRTQLLKKQRA